MNKVVKLVQRTTPEEVISQFSEFELFRLAKAKGMSTQEMAVIIANAINDTLEKHGYKVLN